MMAHGKLVGVIDVQSTRLRAFHDQDRRIMRLIASRVAGSIENASLYRRVNQQNRTFRTLAQLSQEFSSILDLDELLGKIAASVRTLIKYDAFSILLVDAEKQGAPPPLQRSLRSARGSRQHCAGHGNHRRRGRVAANRTRGEYHAGPALHRVASRYSFRDGRAA